METISKIEQLKKRYEDAKLQVKIFSKEYEHENESGEIVTTEKQHIIVSIPEERESRNIIIADNDEIDQVIESKIEHFRFIKGYEAIWSEELKYIECEIEGQDNLLMPRSILRRLKNFFPDFPETVKEGGVATQYEFPSPKEGLKIFIGNSSLEYAILNNFQRDLFLFSTRIRPRLTIRMEGVELKTHDNALELLLKISNAVLFQIDLATNIPLHLVMDRQIIKGIKQRSAIQNKLDFSALKYEYDKEPIALYWYARTSSNMPLLQFLAFYQVMEFYFPLYSFTEAQNRIKLLLKDPFFDTTKDTDIAQIINIIKVSAKGKSIGDEKSQIKATIQNIVDIESLYKYYTENEERKDFFDQQKKSKSISKQKMNFSSIDNDIRIETALRIYEIRCRIVHSKEEDESELILPYSTEIKNLKHDLELIEFLARKAIIAGARPLIL
ncbi:MAG: hypothetical protein JST82_02575 [Bacteroidetes bacterium]|nr:hypothetical protein [Bacteroidota bacterium]